MIPLLFLLLAWTSCGNAPSDRKDNISANITALKLHEHARELKEYAATQKASATLGILVDMSIPSYKKRLFVVDLENDSVLVSGLCAHGQGNDFRREEVVFSNVVGSNCTSQGRYRIGGKYSGQFGEAYRLYGLDSTNSNALKRFVVFHYYPAVSDFEDDGVCRSNGCPMVSPNVFKETSKYLDVSDKPVLLWIYK